MIVKFFYRLLQGGGFRWINRDSDHLREQHTLHARRMQERDDEHERKQSEDADALFDVVLITDSVRRALEDLSRDIADAIRATRTAYEKALIEQQRAQEALDEARDNALQLSDGSRVYFTPDGARLFDEEGREITDEAIIGQAHGLHDQKPGATSYEVYLENWIRFSHAKTRVQNLATALDKLDDLQTRLEAGIATPEELAKVREELQSVLQALPPEARHEYERVRSGREANRAPAYRDAGPAYESSGGLNTDFAKAQIPPLPDIPSDDAESIEKTDRLPVYRSTPDQ